MNFKMIFCRITRLKISWTGRAILISYLDEVGITGEDPNYDPWSSCDSRRSVQGTDNFRIIITLELCVDLNHELCVALHATQCAGGIDGETSPRRVCLSCK